MKTIRLTLLWLWCLAYMAWGGTVVIAWNPSPATDATIGYRVYQGIRLIKTVKGTQATVTLPNSGVQTLAVTAYNLTGESIPTEIKLVPVVVQTSNELKIWTTLTTLYIEQAPRMFFRLTPPTISNDPTP
jgi:hypothetical protein